ncbi:MAG TPA: LysM peptidoglycan-binding domain-containing protein [Candidatus Limnocylindrales bacterium]
MTDRGLPIVDGAPACPFVAFEDDRDARATSPDHRHRCYAEVRPAPRAIAHQEAYCLSSQFPVCPTFQDWARREAAQTRPAAAGAVPGREPDPAQRNPPRDWSAPPPWAPGAAAAAGAAAAGAAMGDAEEDGDGADDGDDWHHDDRHDPDDGDEEARARQTAADDEAPWSRPTPPVATREPYRPRDGDAPGFLASRSAAVEGAGLAGSAADRIAGGPEDRDDVGRRTVRPSRPGEAQRNGGDRDDGDRDDDGERPWADRSDGYDEEADTRARRRSPRASGGIGFGDRRPRVGQTRRAQGWDDVGPSWERPRNQAAYPTLKTRVGLPRLSPVGIMAIALVLAAIGLFFLPQLLGVGSPDTGGRPTPPAGGSPGASASLAPTPIPEPTPLVYVVRSGDTLSSIAKQFGVTLDDLIAANRETIPNPDALQIGDIVVIPSAAPSEIGGSPEASAAP